MTQKQTTPDPANPEGGAVRLKNGLRIPPSCKDVTAERLGQTVVIAGPPLRPKPVVSS
jgi:hypothetical protein